MLLAAEYRIDVPSHANMQTTLATIKGDEDQPRSPSGSSQDNSSALPSESRTREEGQRTVRYPLQGRKIATDMNPDVLVSP